MSLLLYRYFRHLDLFVLDVVLFLLQARPWYADHL